MREDRVQLPGMSAPQKRFVVALSFPGEYRPFVSKVAARLAELLGRQRVLFDDYLTAELARPNLDTYLGLLYREQSELLVPFYCLEYERKEWCGLEWRQMRDIIKQKGDDRVMPFRFDDSAVSGVLSIDGYVMVGSRTPEEVADLIIVRLRGDYRSTFESGHELSPEEQTTAGVFLLYLLSQAYYKTLEGAFGNGVCAVDLDLNGSYLWIISNITNLMKNFDGLADFPEPFEPIVPNLFPSTIRDIDWEDMISPHAEEFLGAVQRYLRDKRVMEPVEGSPAWVFIELFRPAIDHAIEAADAYSARMKASFRELLAKTHGAAKVRAEESPATMERVALINKISELGHGEIDALVVAIGAVDVPGSSSNRLSRAAKLVAWASNPAVSALESLVLAARNLKLRGFV